MKSKQTSYHKSNHIVYKCTYHIIFCPKYRRKIFKDGIDETLKELIYNFSLKKNFSILEMEIMEDHIHLLVDMYPEYSPLEMVKQLKYYTAIYANIRMYKNDHLKMYN